MRSIVSEYCETMIEQSRIHDPQVGDESRSQAQPTPLRKPYYAPTLEPLGAWSTLTLQQSVPIGMFSDLP